jgi:hypothetical protein
MLISPAGDIVYLGSSQGLMTITTSTNIASNNTAAPGKVLAVSRDGQAIVADTSVVRVVKNNGTTAASLSIAGATTAAFSADGHAYILAGQNLYVFLSGGNLALPPQTLSASATDVAFLTNGALGFAGQGNSKISAFAGCDDSAFGSVSTSSSGVPQLLRSLPDGSALLAVTSPGISVITPPSPLSGCPPSGTLLAPTSKDFQQGSFSPRQLIVLSDARKAYVISDKPELLVYDVKNAAPSTLALAGNATPLSGGALLDATKLYVGGSDNSVHIIDTAAGSDIQQISVSTLGFAPDLVAVKP